MTIKQGQLTKPQIKQAHKALNEWMRNNAEKIIQASEKPEFGKWLQFELHEVRLRIDSQDYWSSIYSHMRHIDTSLNRMLSGEIVDVTETGGFITKGIE